MKFRLQIIFTITVAGILALSSSEILPNTNAQIMYSSSYSQSTVPLSEIYSVTTKQVKYNIPYDMTGGTVNEMIPYCESGSLVIRITSPESGKLAIDIPRNLLDMKYENDEDKDFIILVDGEETNFEEARHTYSREYSISLTPNSNEIEIVGTLFLSDGIEKIHCEISHNPPYAYILPPLKQMKNNVFSEDVICEPNLAKAYKFSNGNPVCIKPSSIEDLSERKWTTKPDNSDVHILKYSPVLFKGTGIIADKDNLSLEDLQKLEQRKLELEKLLDNTSLDEKTYNEFSDEHFMIQLHAKDTFDEEISWELVRILWEKYKKVGENLDNFDRSVFPIVSLRGLSIGSNAYTVNEEYSGKSVAISVGILKNQFTKQTLEKTDQMLRELVGDEMDIVYHKSGYAILNQTEQLWKSTEDWNSLRLIRSDDGLYCSPNEESPDHCYSLEEIVFGNGYKRSEHGWKVYPGAGITLPENSRLMPIYKNSALGLPQIDLNAMLDDKIFADKCESNGGTWNYNYHDCEGLMQVCNAIGGIYLNEDVTPLCDPLNGCNASGLIRVSCVFEYENQK